MKLTYLIATCLLLSSCTSEPLMTSHPVRPTFDPSGPYVSAAGIEYKVITTGQGRSASAAKHIRAWNITRAGSDLRVIDDSYDFPQPLEFVVEDLKPGWNIAIRKMKEGDVWLVKIPPELAYGTEGHPPEIGPNETLYCIVNLVEIVD